MLNLRQSVESVLRLHRTAIKSQIKFYMLGLLRCGCARRRATDLTDGARIRHLTIHYTVPKNVTPLACYNFDTRERILICFGRNVTDKVSNQKTLYYATSNNLCFCTTW